jgi:hypothetical protein
VRDAAVVGHRNEELKVYQIETHGGSPDQAAFVKTEG